MVKVEFYPKFGNQLMKTNDIIGLLAFIVSAITVLYVRKARMDSLSRIDVDINAFGDPYFSNINNKWKYFLYFEFIFTNHGGRPTSLLNIEPFDEYPKLSIIFINLLRKRLGIEPIAKTRFLMIDRKDGKFDSNPQIDHSIFLIKESFDQIKKRPDILDSYYDQSKNTLSTLNIKIGSGETEYLKFGIILDCYRSGKKVVIKNNAKTVFLSLRLRFNNTQKYVLRQSIDLPSGDKAGMDFCEKPFPIILIR